jgi:hypothetical protein
MGERVNGQDQQALRAISLVRPIEVASMALIWDANAGCEGKLPYAWEE